MNIDDNTLITLAYVQISKYRTNILNTLTKEYPLMPREISKESGIIMNHVSKVLSELKEKELIRCLNPEYRKGRLYVLTENGETIKTLLNKTERYIIIDGMVKDTYTDLVYHNLEEVVSLLNEQ